MKQIKKNETKHLSLSLSYFYDLNPQNRQCVDCRTSCPTYASINNGTLICKVCATEHLKLGYEISYLRKLTKEWDLYILNFIIRGGNERFLAMCTKFDLYNYPIDYKYRTKISFYYRALVYINIIINSLNLKLWQISLLI